jgi:hypothetical protein
VRVASTEVDRARLLVLASAWWTLGQMESTGVSFEEFLELANSTEAPRTDRARSLWSELTKRLAVATTASLEKFPESVLTPEAREFIEALIVGSFSKHAK